MRPLILLFAAVAVAAQTPNSGNLTYNSLCAACHGADGNGGERAPGVVARIATRTDAELAALIRSGITGAGMPGYQIAGAQLNELVAFLRSLRPRRYTPPERLRAPLTSGGTLDGLVLARGAEEVAILGDDRKLHLLRVAGASFRKVTSETPWPTYHGDVSANRYSTLTEINEHTVQRLAPAWIFHVPGAGRLQVTPVVVDGVMYVTAPNQCYALDAGTGRTIWTYQRPLTKGVVGDAGSGINRGVAISGHRLFMVTDNAHLIALNRHTGALEWETVMADFRENYGATSAPLAVGGLVMPGISGGDEGVRGFLAAYDQNSGKEVWRFWTVPKRGEPKSETWVGDAIEHGCAATWQTGSYDPALDTLYWPTGNPCPDYNGDGRKGDNLYSDSMLALDLKTGRLKWYFQYTPHDLWDWDAQQPPVLVDRAINGQPRKLLLHANRNGFFYVLDRTTGELISATPFVNKLTWATRIAKDGRPVLNGDPSPTAAGVEVCPAVEGATNWFSTSFHPGTGLYYVQTLEKCNIFTKAPGKWVAGQSYYDGATRQVPGLRPRKILRALDPTTGKIAWELPQEGPGNAWGGALSTAGGIVIFADDSGRLAAARATDGKRLWSFPLNVGWKASPMTYQFDSRQHVAIAAGPNIVAFKLVE